MEENRFCDICGKPSGNRPLCDEHYKMFDLLCKCEFCGAWHYIGIKCSKCNFQNFYGFGNCIICGDNSYGLPLCRDCYNKKLIILESLKSISMNDLLLSYEDNKSKLSFAIRQNDMFTYLLNMLSIAESIKNTYDDQNLYIKFNEELYSLLSSKTNMNCRYTLKTSLLTDAENFFYEKLKDIFEDKYIILPQIHLLTIIKKNYFSKNKDLNRIVDYGIFNDNYKPLALIELNGDSHYEHDRLIRDEQVSNICLEAGIPLITFWLDEKYSDEQIKKEIESAIKE